MMCAEFSHRANSGTHPDGVMAQKPSVVPFSSTFQWLTNKKKKTFLCESCTLLSSLIKTKMTCTRWVAGTAHTLFPVDHIDTVRQAWLTCVRNKASESFSSDSVTDAEVRSSSRVLKEVPDSLRYPQLMVATDGAELFLNKNHFTCPPFHPCVFTLHLHFLCCYSISLTLIPKPGVAL